MDHFVSDLKQIRERARSHMETGAVTESYKADRVEVLNEVLATETVCVLRYKRHFFMARGIDPESVKAEFLQHANDEQQHCDRIAGRIIQLNGAPNFNPQGLSSRSHSKYQEGSNLIEMIKEDLVAERVAVQSYAEIAHWLAENDPTTRRLIEKILKMEEEHADDLANMLTKAAS